MNWRWQMLPGTFGDAIEILVLALFAYYVMVLFKGRRGAPILIGFALAIGGALVLTRVFHMDTLNWIFSRFSVYLAVAVLVIFQPEIRQVLAELGTQHFFGGTGRALDVADRVADAAAFLAGRKIGGLIAIEQAIGTRAVQQTGTPVDAVVSSELISSIFFPYTPLHDGGVVIVGERIAAAGCMFPLSERADLAKSMGSRHRAAVGMVEETDAVVVVVSEETGAISLCHKGEIKTGLAPEQLRAALRTLLRANGPARSRFGRGRGVFGLFSPRSERRTGEGRA